MNTLKELEIGGVKHLLMCNIVNDRAECILYNDKDFWSTQNSWEQVLRQVKQLNKRVLYKDDIIRDTLQSGTPQQCFWEDIGNEEEMGLKLKYDIVKPPFTFLWKFNRQSEQDLGHFMLNKMANVLSDLVRQVDELRKTVRAKDAEINQYKDEGAVLGRKTLATKPFNFNSFDSKYAESNSASLYLQQMAKHLKEKEITEVEVEASMCGVGTVEKNAKSKQEDAESSPKQKRSEKELPTAILRKQKESPRNRKRKVREIQAQHVQQRLNARKQKMEYESSQDLSEELDTLAEIAAKKLTEKTDSHQSPMGTQVLHGRRINFEEGLTISKLEHREMTLQRAANEKAEILLETTKQRNTKIAASQKTTKFAEKTVHSPPTTNVFDIHTDVDYILNELKSCDERLSAYNLEKRD